MTSEKTESQNKNSIQKYIGFIKEYFSLITISLLAILLMFDYFIFTDVLHLNQAYFFNNLLGIIAQEQPILLIFVILPVLFILLLFVLLYKIQFEFLNQFFEENYRFGYKILNSKNIIHKTFIIIFSVIFIIYGDLLVFITIDYIYDLFKKTSFEMTTLAFFFTMYFLYAIYNVLVLFLLVIISSNLIIKFKTHITIILFLGFFTGAKLGAYPLLKLAPYLQDLDLENYSLFILLNFAFFIPTAIVVILKKFNKKPNPVKKETKLSIYIEKTIVLLIVIVGINIYFINLYKLYQEPYTKKEYWDKVPTNSLSQGNLSLLLSPLKIVHDDEMEIDLNKIKQRVIKKFAFENNVFDDVFIKELKYFYIPYQNYRIVFIQDKNDNRILIVFGLFKENTLIKILDVGYIKLK